MEDLAGLYDRLRGLVERPPPGRSADVEHTLTDGYAHALALEAERRRGEERLRALAAEAGAPDELRELSARLDGIDAQLRELRGLLAALATTL